MDMLNLPKISPEQEAIWAASRKRWKDGIEAGEAGLACPEGAEPMAYKSGLARRRVKAGEVIGFVMQTCLCKKCGEGNYYWRLGCRCWPDGGFDVERNEREGYAMEYGYQVDAGSDPDAPESTFMTHERLFALAQDGREVIDTLTGEPVPVIAHPKPTSSNPKGDDA